ncbi:hypothetical protein KY332_03065 [Candidatus Woesearchaeota archaeon]|nr:hypothetical protein [Candidatus Woesearchaeota archaeon]
MNKSAQAAMEFLMTYGWALLVVLAAIGALAYFGVLRPQSFLPEQCVLAPGVACLDFKVTSGGINLAIGNSLGRDIDLLTISAGNCSQSFNQTLNNGGQSEFALTGCDNGDVGAKFKEDLIIEYMNQDSSFTKTITGSIAGKVQDE